jgi:hypothetical protein
MTPRRSSESEPADARRDKSNVSGGWLRSLTFALAERIMSTPRVLCLLSLLLVCGCTTTATRQYRAAEEPRIVEAALLQQLALRDTNRVVFVSFSDSQYRSIDPPDIVLERLHAAGRNGPHNSDQQLS